MAKIRVYELATKLGLDNSVLVDKLNQAGIEVKNHMSALEEEVAHKFEAGQSDQASDAPAGETVEVEVKEERISSGLIRRRKKVVKKEPAPEEAPATTEDAAPVAEEAVDQEETTPEKEPAEEKITEAAEMPQVDIEVPAEKVEKAAPAKKKEKKETVTRAKILGRVELPKPVERPRRQAATPARSKKPAPASADRKRADRPGRPAAPVTPMMQPELPSEKEGRSTKKKKKGRDNVARTNTDGPRRKTRREVYEPDRNERYRKGRKSTRPAKKTEITQ
jgi:translation initiation factor IF-2